MSAGYYRFPTIHENTVVFVSEDDLWSVPVTGGLARRLTNHLGPVSYPFFSPDGRYLAFVGREEGAPEVYIMPAEGGPARRLTYLSSQCRVLGWNTAGTHILFTSAYGQINYSEMSLYQIHYESPNGSVEALPYGPARSIAFGPVQQVVLGRNTGDPALWKRYRGGTAGYLWINNKTPKSGTKQSIGEFERLLPDLKGNVASPMWLRVKNRNRIFFISDHEGIGNLYSCTPSGKDLRRHSDHNNYYARNPSSDGNRIVYHAGADLFVYDVVTDSAHKIDVDYRSSRVERNRKFVSPMGYLNEAELHPSGKALTIVTRGKPFTFYNHEGPVFQHGKRDGIRYRQPIWFNDGERLLVLSDEMGEEAFEIHFMDLDKEPFMIEGLDIGRPVQIKFSPVEDKLVLSNHRHELILIDFEGVGQLREALRPEDAAESSAKGEPAKGRKDKSRGKAKQEKPAEDDERHEPPQPKLTVIDRSPVRRIAGFDWAPDGKWIAYGYGATLQTTAIRLYQMPDPEAENEAARNSTIHTITQPVLHDLGPSFDPDGKFLYFISAREFNPIYDSLQSLELSFPWGMRPYLVTLQNDVPNPFIPRPDMDDDDPEENEEDEGMSEQEDGMDEDGMDEDVSDEETDDSAEDEADDGDEDDEDILVSVGKIHPQARASALPREHVSATSRVATKAIFSSKLQGRAAVALREGAKEVESTEEAKEKKKDQPKRNGKGDGKEEGHKKEKPKFKIDVEGIERRVLAFPVPDGRYGQIAGVAGKALFTVFPVQGVLGSSQWDDEQEYGGSLRAYDFKEYRSELLADRVNFFSLSQNRKRLLYYSGGRLRVIAAGEKVPGSAGSSRKSGWIDTDRVRVSVDPATEWQQMLREAWRLQRDYFWTEDMSGVDWVAVYEQYRSIVDRVSTRGELSDLIWEMQGELGTSHAYEIGGDYPHRPYYFQGTLGADFTWAPQDGGYIIGDPIVGDPWNPYATSPLAAPGIDVKEGDVLVAINGQRLDAQTSPAQLLVGHAWSEVLLTFKARPDGAADVAQNREDPPVGETDSKTADKALTEIAAPEGVNGSSDNAAEKNGEKEKYPYRNISVKTLFNETPVRYRAWVETNRKKVHAATNGRIGYVHIPDMTAFGFAEFHRGYLAETDRDGLIIDVRYNGGGHVSQLILEKLARRRIGFDMSRWGGNIPYPADSIAGPMVAVTNELAGSDGDIFCHSFKLMKLGPLIGKRTWGGVVGIWPKHELIDGSITTQPEYGYWFEDVGWAVENYGTEPDIEVEYTPQDYAEGRDPQLDRGIEEVLKLLETTPILKPDMQNRPILALPKLPPRKPQSSGKAKQS